MKIRLNHLPIQILNVISQGEKLSLLLSSAK